MPPLSSEFTRSSNEIPRRSELFDRENSIDCYVGLHAAWVDGLRLRLRWLILLP